MTWIQIALIVYGVGVVVDFNDSRTRFRRQISRSRAVRLALIWPVTVLTAIYQKVIK